MYVSFIPILFSVMYMAFYIEEGRHHECRLLPSSLIMALSPSSIFRLYRCTQPGMIASRRRLIMGAARDCSFLSWNRSFCNGNKGPHVLATNIVAHQAQHVIFKTLQKKSYSYSKEQYSVVFLHVYVLQKSTCIL
jgi:hypothetical protein